MKIYHKLLLRIRKQGACNTESLLLFYSNINACEQIKKAQKRNTEGIVKIKRRIQIRRKIEQVATTSVKAQTEKEKMERLLYIIS